MRKIVWVVTLVVVVLGILCGVFRIQGVGAYGIVYIRAEGYVEPSTAPIKRDGDVYTFTDDCYSQVVVERNGVTIDGNKFTVEGNGSGYGFRLGSDVIVKNVVVKVFEIGFYLDSSSNNTIRGNVVMENGECGVYLGNSSDNSVVGNDLRNNFKGFWLWGCLGNNVSGNNVTAGALYNDYGVRLEASSRNVVSGNNIGYNDEGVFVVDSSGNIVSDNNLMDNYYGVVLTNSSENVVCGNTIEENDQGVEFRFSSNNIVRGCKINSSTNHGVWLFQSLNNTVSRNHIIENRLDGIWLSGSSRNIFSENTVRDNREYGISVMSSCLNNQFYHNNLISNTRQVLTSGYTNYWDDGYISGGNYWSNYKGADLNHDGIGETQFEIDENNVDHYPLTGMFCSFNTSSGYQINVVSNSTVEQIGYFHSNNTIKILVTNSCKEQIFGFCRVRIPYPLISDPCGVTVNGDSPIYWNYTLFDNGENRWIYFVYENLAHEIVVVPEFQPAVIFPLFLIAILLTYVAAKKEAVICKEKS